MTHERCARREGAYFGAGTGCQSGTGAGMVWIMVFFLFCFAGAQENRILELEFMIRAVGNTVAADTRYRNSDQGSEGQGFDVGCQGWNEGEEHPSGRRRGWKDRHGRYGPRPGHRTPLSTPILMMMGVVHVSDFRRQPIIP